MRSVRQLGALVVGVVLCSSIFLPLSTALLVSLWLRTFSYEHPVLNLVTDGLASSLASCISGLLTGLVVGFLSTSRETRTALLASLLVLALFAFMIAPLPSFEGALNIGTICFVTGEVVSALGLCVFAILGAWLVARRRGRSRPPAEPQACEGTADGQRLPATEM